MSDPATDPRNDGGKAYPGWIDEFASESQKEAMRAHCDDVTARSLLGSKQDAYKAAEGLGLNADEFPPGFFESKAPMTHHQVFLTQEELDKQAEEARLKAELSNRFAEVSNLPSANKPAQKQSRKTRRHEAAIVKKLNEKVSALTEIYFYRVDAYAKKLQGIVTDGGQLDVASMVDNYRARLLSELNLDYKQWVRERHNDYNYSAVAGLFLVKVVDVSRARAGVK